MPLRENLRIRGLGFTFRDGFELFSSINFDLASDEFVVLFGGNGSGKSTLLRCLSGISSPACGEISIEPKSSSGLSMQVGLVFQNPEHQMIAPTVEEEIALGLELAGVHASEIEERVEGEIERFGLQEIRRRCPEELSGGQMQKVALASILILRPSFLLLDEPDSLLDAPSRREFMEAVNTIRADHGILWACADAERIPNASRYLLLTPSGIEATTRERILEAAN
jgi:energy-coupling factor transporter ATP-binding protein EcfA2